MRKKDFIEINIPALIVLAVLKEKQSILKTAAHLKISQSTASKLLIELKEEFNDPLYSKVNNVFTFTKIGDSISSISSFFFEPGAELIERIKQHRQKEYSIMLPKWVDVSKIRSSLSERFPSIDYKCSFRLFDDIDLESISDSLMTGFVDVCICHFPIYRAGVQSKTLCTTELVFLSKKSHALSIQNVKKIGFVKYNVSKNLFNSFLLDNNLENLLTLSENIYGVDQWLDSIDDNKVIITTDHHVSGFISHGYRRMVVTPEIKTKYPVHMIWHNRYKHDEFVSELCKIIVHRNTTHT